MIDEKLSTYEIAKKTGKAQSTVRYWIIKYNLVLYNTTLKKQTEEERKALNVFYVTNRRKKVKKKAVDYKGGKCEICGYNKCIEALEFHHKDPSKKDFSLGAKGHSRSWDRVKEEIEKCVLLCSNCHREIHAKIIEM